MLGSIAGSSLLWRKISNYERMLTLSFLFMIGAFSVALFADSLLLYGVIFFLFGVGLDGLSISGMNLVIEIAPQEKRPIYTALQTNITSLGLFFPVLGGLLLKYSGSYTFVYLLTIGLLGLGFLLSLSLKGGSNED
jgi:MFS family permease